jgi:CheY-like chemotaxis protein
VHARFLEAVGRRAGDESNIVLVVDDDPDMRHLVVMDIQKTVPRIEIYEAGNGREALAQLAEIRADRQTDPVLIVTDLNMPEMDGWEVIRRLEKEYRAQGRDQGIPIIVLSSTEGEKGRLFRQSVHGDKAHYVPLVSVAKDSCVDPAKYDAVGQDGLLAWTRHFLHRDR